MQSKGGKNVWNVACSGCFRQDSLLKGTWLHLLCTLHLTESVQEFYLTFFPRMLQAAQGTERMKADGRRIMNDSTSVKKYELRWKFRKLYFRSLMDHLCWMGGGAVVRLPAAFVSYGPKLWSTLTVDIKEAAFTSLRRHLVGHVPGSDIASQVCPVALLLFLMLLLLSGLCQWFWYLSHFSRLMQYFVLWL